jgi:hypothetical protein
VCVESWKLFQISLMDNIDPVAAATISSIESALQIHKKKIGKLLIKFMFIFFLAAGLSGWFLFNNYILNLLFVIPLFFVCVFLLVKWFKRLLKFESEYEMLKKAKRKILLENGKEFLYFRTS